METFSTSFLEVLKYTIPALVVWGVVYWMAKSWIEQRRNDTIMAQRQSLRKETLPMKIQALERLALFVERISPSQVLSRVHAAEMNAQTLGRAMLIAIQKEYEHNVTQQIYVSEPLWSIIYLAKNEVLNLVTECMDQHGKEAPGADLANEIIRAEGNWQLDPVRQALQAIRKEASVILNP